MRRSKRINKKISNDLSSHQFFFNKFKLTSPFSIFSSNLTNSNTNLLSYLQASSPSNFISFYDNEPPFLAIGTDVSAKYKGAFCEAKVKDIHRCVKCRVTFKNNFGSVIITDDNIKGTLRVGSSIQAKHPDKNQYLEGIINKIIDASQYTVVFDDGDETTLRRTSLCLKSGKHFAESESLDHLPLTNPEHFGNPVNLGFRGGRRRRKRVPTGFNSNTSYSSAVSDAEDNESAEGDALIGNSGGSIDDEDSASNLTQPSGSGGNSKDDVHEKNPDWGKVVCVEYGDKRGAKAKETWFPALIVSPAAQESYSKLDESEEYLVKSFINGRYYQVAKKDVKELTKKSAHLLISDSSSSSGLKTGLEKALNFIENDGLPFNWDHDLLLGAMTSHNNNNGNNNCYLNAATSESDSGPDEDDDEDNEQSEEKDRFVAQLYKYMDERGTPINKAPCVASRDLDLYKLYRLVAKVGGYNRVTNKNLWKKLYYKMSLPHHYLDAPLDQAINQLKHAYKKYLLSFDDFYRKLGCTMVNNTLSFRSSGRLARSERTWRAGNCSDKEKDQAPVKSRRKRNSVAAESEKKDETNNVDVADKNSNNGDEDDKSTVLNKKSKKRGKLGRKRGPKAGTDGEESVAGENVDEKSSNIDSETESEAEYDAKMPTISKDVQVNADDRIKVKYGKGKAVKIYEAKVLKSDNDTDLSKRRYFVHYTGWNVRYDEWIKRNRIVEVVKDKITKRKGGNKMKGKASSGHSDHLSKYEDNSEAKETKDSKDVKTATPQIAKRGRPSSANENKQNEGSKLNTIKKETRLTLGGKRRLKTDTSNKNLSLKEKLELPTKVEPIDDYKKSTIHHSSQENDLYDIEKHLPQVESESEEKSPKQESENDGSRGDHSPESLDKNENEESTDVDTIEVSMSNSDVFLKEEKNQNNKSDTYLKENIDDILTCDENLTKSPPPSLEESNKPKINIKEESKELDKSKEFLEKNLDQVDSLFENEKDKKPIKGLGKRKRMNKQWNKKEKDKKRCQVSDQDEEDEDLEFQEDKEKLVLPKQRKKQRKKKEEAFASTSFSENEAKKNLRFSSKKKQKSRSPGNESVKEENNTSLSPGVENENKGKKRKRSLNKLKPIDIPNKNNSQLLNEQKLKEISPSKKKFKKEAEEKKRKEKDSIEKETDKDEQENLEIANLFKDSSNEKDKLCEEIKNRKNVLQEMGGSFLLCKEEVPASPVHQSEGSGEALKSFSLPCSSSNSEENDAFTSSLSATPCQISLPLSEEKLSTTAQSTPPLNEECPQFTPPTTPDSLKSGILSSTPSLHERESSDNEKNQTHLNLTNVPIYSSSEIENVNKVSSQSLNPLDSLASVAAVTSVTQKSPCSSPHPSDDYCSKNSLSELNKKVPQITSLITSPKKKRRGRVRISSASEPGKEVKSNFQTIGCKTRGSLGRKARQHFDANSEAYSNNESNGPMSPAFPSISLSNYSPNAFVYSVNPTSKYNFCTPIDESLEAEKRILILQERLQELRKTYLNIKSEVASIERRRKKVKKKDKEKDIEKEIEKDSEKDADKDSLNHSVYNNVA